MTIISAWYITYAALGMLCGWACVRGLSND